MRFFFFGLGYSALATARAILETLDGGAALAGTTRRPAKRDALDPNAISAHLFTGDAPGETLRPDLVRATHVVISTPPGETGDPVLAHHRADLDAATGLEWICYYSTVGVYGDFAGSWIDETAKTKPVNLRSAQRVEAEEAWAAYAAERGVPLLVLRLAGIYGPGRSSFDKLRAGTARRIVKPDQVFNRIHVEDIGRVTALAAAARLGGIFNLADTEPAPPQDVIAHAAGLIGMDPPPEIPFEEAEMTPMARSFYSDNKRVSAKAITQILGIELLHPTYREGLAAILAAEARGQTGA
ncbi:NAD-dependent epimerase/dehydratase family protein [Arsenicitalea aurantiaca]|uniref:NAD-dependent epimerase/dehydratase family protein n=1 Tax=Arsenicitalea aurantiaca TaxID=1783274 RepID=A0A433X8K8_9HYPH|nr:NAD-dependent epimerase/dehydratase family protein [Arsenicitalea aurantiaca]RUT30437.1 NAD-dependent epimerase/dehydratase family protein [Arsenicitalea aurantiaca]